MDTFLNSVSSVAVILLLTATGYVFAALGWMDLKAKQFISRILLNYIVPINCIYALRTNLDRELLMGYGNVLLISFLSCASVALLSFAVLRILRIDSYRWPVFLTLSTISNAIFIGYPMCQQLFGDACLPFVMLFYLVNTSFMNVLMMSVIRYVSEGEKFSLRVLLKILRTPTIIGIFVGFLLVIADIRLPELLMTYMKHVGNTVTPLALMLVGFIIYEIGLKNLSLDRDVILVMGFRFLIAPALAFLFCHLFGAEGLARGAVIVESAMPVVTQGVAAASEYGLDEKFAAKCAALSTLASFIVIPILMVIL